MPLHDMSADDAVATRKANPLATWELRTAPNRVEPVARPGFDVPFRLEPGEPIFTVGSCFARHVEGELMRRGFRIPMRDPFKEPEFLTVDAGIVNNYGTPSILNEFAWAFGAKPFVPEDQILEVVPGRFADLHLIASSRPDTWEVALRRRAAVTAAYRRVAECRVMVLTLGLVEVWFDTKTGFYVNAPPRPAFLRAEPERFRLHVLDFDEAYRHLEEALLLVREKGNPDLRVILTVSPVPLSATHRPDDVLVANTYSKSVLRAVAETIRARYDWATYFPSYESVTLSDRQVAFEDDLVHVRAGIVALNVGRMVAAFTGEAEDGDDLREAVAAGNLALLVERAGARRAEGAERAEPFFAAFGDVSALSAAFALEHAGHLVSAGREEAALAVLEGAPAGELEAQVALQRGTLLTAVGRAEEAVALLDAMTGSKTRSYQIWNALLAAALATGDAERVSSVLYRWTAAQPSRTAHAYTAVGRWQLEQGNLVAAQSYLEQAITNDPTATMPRIHLGKVFMATGRRDEARDLLRLAQPKSDLETKLLDRIVSTLA